MSFSSHVTGVAEAIQFWTQQHGRIVSEAALHAVKVATAPHAAQLKAMLMSLPVKHGEKQMEHRGRPAKGIFGQRGKVTYGAARPHIWEDIHNKADYYADILGAWALTGADKMQMPLERYIEGGTVARVRYTRISQKHPGGMPTGLMPKFAPVEELTAAQGQLMTDTAISAFDVKYNQLMEQAGLK